MNETAHTPDHAMGRKRWDHVQHQHIVTTDEQEQAMADTRAGLRPGLQSRVYDRDLHLMCDGTRWRFDIHGNCTRFDPDGSYRHFPRRS